MLRARLILFWAEKESISEPSLTENIIYGANKNDDDKWYRF